MSDELDIDYTVDAVLPEDPEDAKRRVDWHARMVRHYAAQLADEIASFEREIERLQAEVAARKRTAQARIDWHTAPVESYHRMLQSQDKDMRTLRTPHATSKITVPKQPVVNLAEGYALDDDDVVVFRWLSESHPEALKLPGISVIRKLVNLVQLGDENAYVVADKTTGETLPFLVAEVPPPTYKLTPEEGLPL